MSKPIAVLISDVHYNINTLEIADKAMRLAINKANELDVVLIVCGDLHDTKAHLRGECVKAMIDTFNTCSLMATVLVGNHDKINEKSTDNALSFLQEHVNFIVDKPRKFDVSLDTGDFDLGYLIPYHHDIDELKRYLNTIPKGSRLIMHQGIQGSNSGEYFQDKSAIRPEDVAGLRVISGHYHNRQTISLPDGGTWNYVGNPYTLNFAEANDPEKGFQILYSDGSLEFVPTNLRKHIKIDITVDELVGEVIFLGDESDIVWVKIRGSKEKLSAITKKYVAQELDITHDFKLELIPNDVKVDIDIKSISQSQPELLDSLIQSLTNVSDEQKKRLKAIWKDLCES